jgi:NAD(P)H dehydrogenase (quinone)
MKILVTGASGPFGSGVARGLIARGVKPSDLILVSRDPTKLTEFTALGAQARAGDFDDYTSLVQAFAGAERMLMISTNRVGQREPQHRNAVNAAKAAGVRHVVYTSFVGRPDCVSMAVSDHRFTEKLLTESGLAWTFLRNSQYSEAMRDAGAPAAIRSGQWLSASGNGRIALVTRDDCIAAAVAVLAGQGHEHERKTYDITGPDLLTYRELAALVSEITGHSISYKEVGAEGMYALFDAIGIPRSAEDDRVVNGFGWCSDDMVSFELTIASGDFAIRSDDLENLTGRKPESMRHFMMRHRDQLMAVQPAARGD